MVDLTKRQNLIVGLAEADYVSAARMLNCEVAAIKAVSHIESGKSGFLASGRPKILFEGHYFFRILKQYGKAGIVAQQYPTICYQRWTTRFYLGNEREYDRLRLALAVCKEHKIPESAALRSASWGKYQIMGDNYQKAGFDTVYSMVETFFQNEKTHLLAFATYLENTFLDDELRDKNWAKFAYGYNGAGYKRNQYDVKMAAKYKEFKKLEQHAPLPAITEENNFGLSDEVEIIEIPSQLSIPDLEPPTKQRQIAYPPQINPNDIIKISPFQTIFDKFMGAKQYIIAALASIGISGTSISALYENLTSNQMMQYVILGIAIISLLVVGILLVVYLYKHLDFQQKIGIENKRAEKDINIEQLRIRANPQLYNVELDNDI